MRLLSTLCAFALATSMALGTASTAQAEHLAIGVISNDARTSIERYTPLATYLEAELNALDIARVEITVYPTIEAISNAVQSGDVDLLFDSPLVTASVSQRTGAVPFLRRWKNGTGTYHSLIIVPTNSSVRSLADLDGMTIAFEEPHSTSGYLVPAAMIRRAGLTLVERPDDQSVLAADVGYVFTESDRNSAYWMALGLVDATATDPRGWAWLNDAQPGNFRILARSADMPRNVVLHRRDLDPEIVNEIVALLMAMESTPEGREILASFEDTNRFDLLPEDRTITFDPIFQLLDELVTMGVM